MLHCGLWHNEIEKDFDFGTLNNTVDCCNEATYVILIDLHYD